MRRAERMIRQKIDELKTMEGIAPRKKYIQQAIEFTYINGSISKRKKEKLTQILEHKYTEIYNKYLEDAVRLSDEAFHRDLRRYGGAK